MGSSIGTSGWLSSRPPLGADRQGLGEGDESPTSTTSSAAYTRPHSASDAGAYSRVNPYAHAYGHGDADSHANGYPAADAKTYSPAHAYPNTYAHSNAGTDTHANSNSSTHARADTHCHPNADGDTCDGARGRNGIRGSSGANSHALVQNVVVALPTIEPVTRPSQRELKAPAVPVIGVTVPRIRDTLSGIASTPRRRTTLIIIQGVTILFAVLVFGYLGFRRR